MKVFKITVSRYLPKHLEAVSAKKFTCRPIMKDLFLFHPNFFQFTSFAKYCYGGQAYCFKEVVKMSIHIYAPPYI